MCILWAVRCHNKSTFLQWNRHIMWWRCRLNVRSSLPCSREAVQAELDRTQDHTGSGEETEKGLQSVSQSVCTWVWYQWGCFLLWNRNVLADVLWWPRGGRCGPRWEVSSIKQLRPSSCFLPHLRTSYRLWPSPVFMFCPPSNSQNKSQVLLRTTSPVQTPGLFASTGLHSWFSSQKHC